MGQHSCDPTAICREVLFVSFSLRHKGFMGLSLLLAVVVVGFFNAGTRAVASRIPTCSGWQVVKSPNGSSSSNGLQGVAAISASDTWAVGSYFGDFGDLTLTEHWTGSHWSIVPSPNPALAGGILNSVTAISSTDVWAVGQSQDLRTLVEH